VLFFDVEDIDWIEAQAKIVRLHTTGAVYPLRESIGRLEEKLDPARFLRIHRSAIVNVERIAEIDASEDGGQTVVLRNGERLPLSRSNRLKLYEVAAEGPAAKAPCHPEERSDEGSALSLARKTEILRCAQDDKEGEELRMAAKASLLAPNRFKNPVGDPIA
jgi:hypothetical protein